MTKKTRFFRSSGAFRKWLEKNHSTQSEIWLGLYKKSYKGSKLEYREAIDVSLCFGWVVGIIKSIDESSYQVRFCRRKPKSQWSMKNVQRFKELRKEKKVHPAGLKAFNNREKHSLENKLPSFSKEQLKTFKANKKAWDFFSQQTKSYQKYTTQWVISAKREETQNKRLLELIKDSAQGSKLARIVKAQEKVKPKYEPGKTPIEAAKNLGPVTGSELRSVGIETVEKLKDMGWRDSFIRLYEYHPHRLNLNMLVGLIGAIEEQDWRKIDSTSKAEAKRFLESIKRNLERI